MRLRAELSITLLAVSLGITLLSNTVILTEKSASDKDQVFFNNDEIEERYTERNSPDDAPRNNINNRKDREKHDEYDLEKIPKNKKFMYRDFEACIPGQESVNSCDSNPDQARCDDGTYPITRQLVDDEGRFVRQYRFCPGDPPQFEIPKDQLVPEILIDIERFRSYPIKASTIKSEPNEFSLRNGNTHLWATAENQTFNSNLSGSTVRIKAIPIQWNWNYGDGTTRNLDFPGEPAPNHTLRDETPTSHSYGETGKFKVGVTTLYRGEFSVDGGPWQAIPGQAAVVSTPIEIDVWRTEKELIAND
ncbi:hypothetical protein ACR9WD_09805 [Glutamicibacter sp. PAEs-4]|uniref:hypothetical protein n=1 Tax=Glutamicibacter TaxID=1742989 RepID=UPI00167F827C|nr:hypothetical protein [Glutamicibacter nicotianae]WIV42688.1 hypothetical protein QQS42_10145 [Glutamicibacter nicotianae]